MKPRMTHPVVPLAIILLIALIFILDELSPQGEAVWLLYLLPLLLTSYTAQRRYPVIVAAACTALALLGFFVSPPGVSIHLALLNRAMGVTVLWVAAALLTRRKQAEATLHRERVLLSRITETSPVAITVANREGQITFANRRAEEVLGVTRDQMTGTTFNAPSWRITDYEGGPFPDEQLPFRRVMDTGQAVFDVQHAIEWPDGRRVLLSINAAPLTNEAGEVDGMVATVEDVTERVLLERDRDQLLRREQAARIEAEAARDQTTSILERISDAFVALDTDWRYTYMNAKAGQIFDRQPRDMIGKHIWTEFPEGVGQPFHLAYEKAMAEQTPIQLEEYYPPYDLWFENRIYPSPEGLSIFFQDITERKRAETLLASERHLLELISTSAPLDEVLNAIVKSIEALSKDTLGSIQLLGPDGLHVHHGAAPSLPEAYNRALEGAEIGPAAGSCGTAAYHRAPVIVTDIETDPLWQDYRELARAHGLRACWSTPIMNSEGSVLGTFAMYYRQPRSPEEEDFRLIERATHIAGIAIERARAEAALRESEERLRLALTAAAAGIWTWEGDTGVSSWDEQFHTLYGFTADQPRSFGAWIGRLHPEDRPLILARLDQMRTSVGDDRWAEEFRSVLPGDTVRWHSGLGLAERDATGAIRRMVGIDIDITAHKQAEEELRLSEERFSNAFHVGPAGMTITRVADGRFIDANESFLAMFEFSREEVIGHTSTELGMWTPEQRAQLIRAQLESGGLRDCELRVTSRSGKTIDILFSSKPMELEGHTCHVTTMIDITERKRAEEVLQEYSDRLQSLSRELLAVQERERRHLATELHDEIGQLLTGLKLTLEMGRRLPPEAAEASTDEAQGMVSNLMSEIRNLSLELRPSMLDDLGLLPTLLWHFDRYTSQTGVRVEFKQTGLDRRLPPDIETAAYRIVQEALTNVARYAGVLEVNASLRAEEDRPHLLIEDRGVGFDVERAMAAQASLGLAGMRERVTLLGGNLTVESKPGEGTRVEGEVPL